MIADELIGVAIARMQDNPFSSECRNILADMIEENDQIWQAKALRAGRIPLTEFDQTAAYQLGGCNFAPATFDKRFARDISGRAAQAEPCLTPRQWLWMWVLLHRYRKSVLHANVKARAKERYSRCIELLDLKHLKPIDRRLIVPTQELFLQATMFDGIS